MKASSADPPNPRKPPWLKVSLGGGESFRAVKEALGQSGLHTVCEEARCPNRGACWASGTATFLILGDTCTRSCRFCAVRSGQPGGRLDEGEPGRVAEAVLTWGLRYVVLTSVDRDDLSDGGAAHFARTVEAIRERSPACLVEVLVPDFSGRFEDLAVVLAARPHVLAHNLEVPRRLSATVRDPRASYDCSLDLLRAARRLAPEIRTKSSLMLGLGESRGDILGSLVDLRDAGVDLVTLGQYLRPGIRQLPVRAYVPPEVFEAWARRAESLGIPVAFAGPLVRSSYRAAELYLSSFPPHPPHFDSEKAP